MRVLIVGCGYVGTPLGARLVALGHEVWGVRRTVESAEELRPLGIHPLAADVTRVETLPSLEAPFDWVINAVSSKGGGAEAYEQIYFQGTQNLLQWLQRHPPQRYLHVSSSSVYGQNDGSLVTEESPTEPTNATSQILVATEKLLLNRESLTSSIAMVIRAAGIYGPGRGHLFQQFLRNEARLTGSGARWLNMVHLDDLVAMCVLLLERGVAGQIYNGADDEPVTERDFFLWLSEQLRKPLPESIPEDQKTRKRGATNKRISNLKIRESLGYRCRFPTFREGYGAEIARLRLTSRTSQ